MTYCNITTTDRACWPILADGNVCWRQRSVQYYAYWTTAEAGPIFAIFVRPERSGYDDQSVDHDNHMAEAWPLVIGRWLAMPWSLHGFQIVPYMSWSIDDNWNYAFYESGNLSEFITGVIDQNVKSWYLLGTVMGMWMPGIQSRKASFNLVVEFPEFVCFISWSFEKVWICRSGLSAEYG